MGTHSPEHPRRHGMLYTRRELAALALAAFPASHLLKTAPVAAFQARAGSKVRGVMIGMNVPYNFGGRSLPVDDIIRNCVELGISGVELRTQPVEAFLGAPPVPPAPPAGAARTAEQEAAQKASAARAAQMAAGGRDGQGPAAPEEVRGRRHPRRDRQGRRHPHHARRSGRLRVPAGEGARRARHLD